jgi:hypothetical protein
VEQIMSNPDSSNRLQTLFKELKADVNEYVHAIEAEAYFDPERPKVPPKWRLIPEAIVILLYYKVMYWYCTRFGHSY